MMSDEESYESSERLRQWTSESAMMKKLFPTFQHIERIMANKDYPALGNITIASNKFANERIEELELKIEKLENNKNYLDEKLFDNPYPHIFQDIKAFQFFELLHQNYKNSNKALADYSFIYRKMYEENLILETFKPEMFRSWIAKEPYSKDSLDKIKTLSNCSTSDKIIIYNNLKQEIYYNVP
ncbi:hypothetical protein SAMN05421768_105349 [Chryseobacterium joostei]|uniref:Uncharacterized protein n=2 Tax=Chryseobacterium joostei TaxID=112234 RepID=A0A1N7IHF6_9FLAO|nr:hypothetical protein [Chryseobacterium joostei]SIS36523.1 hypothetical protein SAMN05421768_105349 [Chryseobacterium joostei]